MTVTLYNADCLEILPTLEAGSVDAVITSPPYDGLRTYNDNITSISEKLWKGVISQSYRLLVDGGIMVWIVNDETINGSESGTGFRQALYAINIRFNLHDTMIWDKKSCRYPEINRYYPTFEYMFIFSKGKPKTANLLSDRKNKYTGAKVARKHQIRTKDGKMIANSAYKIAPNRCIKEYGVRFNIWRMPVSASTDIKTGHPAQFPERLAIDHIKSWSNPGDIILDPFMGSGTTGVACVETGRNFIGIEIDADYFKIAQQRISDAEARMNGTARKVDGSTVTELPLFRRRNEQLRRLRDNGACWTHSVGIGDG